MTVVGVPVLTDTFVTTNLFFILYTLIIYFFLMIGKISSITLIPIIAVIVMMFSAIILSRRENILEFNNSLENIVNIDTIK